METGSLRWLSYIFTLATFLFIFFALDRFFGLHYQPQEHRLNTLKEETRTASISTHDDTTEGDKPEANEEVTTEPEGSHETNEDTADYFDNLVANYQEKISKIAENKTRTDIIIRYYHHNPDGDAAYALQKLKFYIHERPVDPAYQDYQSNAIYYGNNVMNEDIKLVAYTLLDAGLPIKVIRSTAYEWKSNSIEIGTDTTLQSLPTMSMEDVINFSR